MTSASKPSDTSAFTSAPPDPTGDGTSQVGGWTSTTAQGSWSVLESLPAQVRVQLAGVTKTGPNQYKASLSLSGTNTLQLTPNPADAQQNATSAVSPQSISDTSFKYVSRNTHVATVDANGLVTAVGRGEVEIVVRGFRNPNLSFTNATPSGTESVDATIQITVLA